MTGTLLPPDVGNGDIEVAAAAANSSFRGTADDNAANSVGHKGESMSEQDDSSDIGDLGVNDGDNHVSDDTEYSSVVIHHHCHHSMPKTVRMVRTTRRTMRTTRTAATMALMGMSPPDLVTYVMMRTVTSKKK